VAILRLRRDVGHEGMKTGMFIITGVSGTGKTTIIRRLQKNAPAGYACHDIEEGHRIPDNAGDDSRRERADHWLRVATANAARGQSTVVSGTLFPEDIDSSPSRTEAPPIRYLLFDAHDEAITHRLAGRFSTQPMRSELRRILNLTPEEFIPATLVYQRELRKAFTESKCDWTTFDTSRASETDTVAFVLQWMKHAE
jgi:hypothetical protein